MGLSVSIGDVMGNTLLLVFLVLISPNYMSCQIQNENEWIQNEYGSSLTTGSDLDGASPFLEYKPYISRAVDQYNLSAGLTDYHSDFKFNTFFAKSGREFHISSHVVDTLSRSRRATSDRVQEEDTDLPDSALTFARQDGHFVIGGLFAVNIRNEDDILCAKVLSPAGMWIESMMYAIDVINNSTDTLPNHKLGFEIRNDCSDPNWALTQALSFVENSQPNEQCAASEKQTVGVVGTGSSKTSPGVANLLELFSMPQVSYSASSRVLSDKGKYPYFLRTVPSDENQARVMADLAEIMQWNYVAILYSSDAYGLPGKDALSENLSTRNVCVVQEYILGSESQAATSLEMAITNIKADPKIEVIFTFLSKEEIKDALKEAKLQGLKGRTWVASDSWGDSQSVVSEYVSVVRGMIGIVPKARIDPNLKGYLASLDPFNNNRNPWYQLTLGAHHNCSFDTVEVEAGGAFPCHGNETFAPMMDTRSEGAWSSLIIDAVHSLAHGLHDVLYECQGPSCVNPNSSVISTEEYFHFVKNVTFKGLTNPAFRFDENGDPMAQYYIFNLQEVNGEFVFKEVGIWDRNQKFSQLGEVIWPNGKDPPISRCSQDCPRGTYLIRQSVTCCWECSPCEVGSISSQNNSESCETCTNGERTDAGQTACIVKPIQYLRWTDPFSIALGVLAVVGFLAVVFCLVVYIWYRHTPTIKATSTELSYILLTAITATLVCIFLYLSKPTDLMCNLQISILGCSFALYVATLLTKTNRISRIFNRKLSDGRPSMFLNIKYQVLFVAVIVMVQAILQVLLIQLFPPKATYDYTSADVTNLVCQHSILSSILAFCYNLLLALLCSFQAFRIRKLPGQFNDSRGICFSMLTFSLLAFIFIATTFTTAGRTKSIISALACFVCGFSGIICMFVPKIWIVLFRPERNIRQSTLRLAGLSSTLNTVTGTVSSDRNSGTTLHRNRSAGLGGRSQGGPSTNDSDHDSGASFASEDEDTEAMDNFLEELARLERELREAEVARNEAVSQADQLYEELHDLEKQHKYELEQMTREYEHERERMRETLVQTGVEEHQLQELEESAQEGARQTVIFVDFAEHLAQMNIERNQLRHQVEKLTKECQHWKDQVLASASITAQELDNLGVGTKIELSLPKEERGGQEQDEETSSKTDSGVVHECADGGKD